MKQGYTHVSYLLDGSGSMEEIKAETIQGFNTFIESQKMVPGKLTLTLAEFNNWYKLVYNAKDIQEVPMLTGDTYLPNGYTALLDSASRLITDTGKALAAMPEDERPEHVIIVIQTDGKENWSRETTREKLAVMVRHQTEVYKWHFQYIGANQDAFAEAQSMGMSGVNYNSTAVGTRAMFAAMGANVRANRGMASGQSVNLTQEEIDAEEQKP